MNDDDYIILDGYDDCVVGIIHGFGGKTAICYDLHKVIEKLQSDGMSEEDAWEWWSYNMVGAYVGETTPVYLQPGTDLRELIDV